MYNTNMEHSAIIKLKEKRDGQSALMTTGSVCRIGNSINITYGQEGALFTIGISDGIVSIRRESEEDYTIILQEGKEHSFSVSTPFGEIPMKVFPRKVLCEESESGILLELLYYVSSGKGSPDKFELYLDCKYDD